MIKFGLNLFPHKQQLGFPDPPWLVTRGMKTPVLRSRKMKETETG